VAYCFGEAKEWDVIPPSPLISPRDGLSSIGTARAFFHHLGQKNLVMLIILAPKARSATSSLMKRNQSAGKETLAKSVHQKSA